jgi:hypothetical protein
MFAQNLIKETSAYKYSYDFRILLKQWNMERRRKTLEEERWYN